MYIFNKADYLIICFFIGCILISCTAENQQIPMTLTPVNTVALTNVSQIQATNTPEKLTSATPSPIPPETIESENIMAGFLIMINEQGIQKFGLEQENLTHLLTVSPEWEGWGARIAKNQQLLAYWVRTSSSLELWTTPLIDWNPKQILRLENSDIKHEFITISWVNNERHLLLRLGEQTEEDTSEFTIYQTYIYDVEINSFVNTPYWSGDCPTLAMSPQTNHVAIWCQPADDDLPDDFLVLEPRGEAWVSNQTPNELIVNCLDYALCAWSADGQYVAYYDKEKNVLLYNNIESNEVITINDEKSISYTYPVWSPNNQFLYYLGACTNQSFSCPNIWSTSLNKKIWQAEDNSNQSKIGMLIGNIAWSPNSSYWITNSLLTTEKGVSYRLVMFEASSNSQPRYFKTEFSEFISDMVWVNN